MRLVLSLNPQESAWIHKISIKGYKSDQPRDIILPRGLLSIPQFKGIGFLRLEGIRVLKALSEQHRGTSHSS